MADNNWNPWKLTAIGMALVLTTALVTGLVVANWSGTEPPRKATTAPAALARPVVASAMPTQAAVDACNRHAAAQAPQRDKTLEVVKDAAIGALYGLNDNRKHDERYRAAYTSCMRSRGYAS